MSFLHRVFGMSPPALDVPDSADPEFEARRQVTEERIQKERQELRQKVQKVQSASRVWGTVGGMIAMMDNDGGRNDR